MASASSLMQVLAVGVLAMARFARGQAVPIQVPVRYFTKNLTENSGLARYYRVPICAQPAAESKFATLSINLPKNTPWSSLSGIIYAEVSTSKTVWNSSTIIAVNYVSSNAIYTPHKLNFSWPYNPAQYTDNTIYLRVRSNNIRIEYALELSFTKVAVNFKGVYNPAVFGTVPPSPQFDVLLQYIRLSEYAQVNNGAGMYVEFTFCVDAFPFRPDSNWGALVTVISAVEYPHSAFDLFLCPKSLGVGNCVPGSVPPDNLNDNAVAVVSARILRTPQAPIEQGIIALIVGQGGTGRNLFALAAEVIYPTQPSLGH